MDYLTMLQDQLQGNFLEREVKENIQKIKKMMNRIKTHWMNKKQKMKKVKLIKVGRNYKKFKMIYKI